jgi:hypothetical protein
VSNIFQPKDEFDENIDEEELWKWEEEDLLKNQDLKASK